MEPAIILVHGAWHSGASWHKLSPALEKRGFRVAAPDLPGHGDNPRPDGEVTLAAYAEAVLDAAEKLGPPAILLGHSMGGAVISMAAERAAERIAGLIYLSAFLLPDGVAMNVRMKEDVKSAVAPHARRLPDRRAIVMGDEGLALIYDGATDEDMTFARRHGQPQVITPMVEPVHVTEERFGKVPRAFIECAEDQAITLAMQRRMQEDWPSDPVITLPSGHMPQIVMPEKLADEIAGIAAAFTGGRG